MGLGGVLEVGAVTPARDFLALLEDAERTTAPDVRADLQHQGAQHIYLTKVGTIFPAPLSATGTPERIRDLMWWRRSVIREGEPYQSFHARAEAQRRELGR